MGLFQLGQDDEDEDEKRSRAISALSAIAKEARGEMPPVDMDLREDPEVREQQAWAKSREDLTALGADNSPVPHEIDPGDSMSPESFEFAARHPSQKQPNTSYMDQLKLDDQLQLDRSPEDTTPGASMMREQADKAGIFEADDKPDALRGLTGKEPPAVLEVKVEKPAPVDEGPIDALRGLTGNAPPGMPKPHTTEGTGRQFDQPRAQAQAQARDDDDRPELSALAVITDVLTNGGRGLAGITRNLAGQQQQYKGEQRQKMLDQQASDYKQAQIRRLDATAGVNAKDKDWQQWKDTDASQRDYEQMRLRENQLGQGDRRVNLAEDRAAQLQDPESALKRTEVTQAERKAAAGVQGRENQKHSMIGQTAGDARTLVTARTDANLDEKHLHATETAGDAGDRAGAVSDATQPNKLQVKATPSPTEQRAQQNEDLARTPIPGVEIEDQDAWNALNPTHTERAKTATYVKGAQTSLDAVNRMIQLREKTGPWSIPEADAYEMRNLQKQVIGGATVAGNSGVLNGSEFPRYAADTPDGSMSASDFADVGIGGLTGKHRDTVMEKLIATRAAMESAFNSGLSIGGARLSGSKPKQAAPAQGKRKPFLYDDATDDGFGKWTVK